MSKPPTRVALMHAAFPLCGSAGQFTFEQVQLSIGMLSGPFPGGNPTGRNWTPSSHPTGVAARLGADVVRYSFILVDFHHVLLSGLPAHHIFNRQLVGT